MDLTKNPLDFVVPASNQSWERCLLDNLSSGYQQVDIYPRVIYQLYAALMWSHTVVLLWEGLDGFFTSHNDGVSHQLFPLQRSQILYFTSGIMSFLMRTRLLLSLKRWFDHLKAIYKTIYLLLLSLAWTSIRGVQVHCRARSLIRETEDVSNERIFREAFSAFRLRNVGYHEKGFTSSNSNYFPAFRSRIFHRLSTP